MNIPRVKQRTVVEQVMNHIKELISSGQYKPHDRIPTEAELARIFGVGRSSIREAIKIFQHLGILESRTKTGTYVCDSSHVSVEALTWSILLAKDDLFEIVDLREVIEHQALTILTESVKSGKKEAVRVAAELQSQVGIMEAAVRSPQFESLVQADYDFHGAIIGSSGNSLYVSIYATLRSFMLEEIKKTNALESERRTMVREHSAIALAVLSGDRDTALVAFAQHIETTRKQLRRSLRTKGG